MNHEEIIKQLRAPFTSREIEWKIQVTTQDKSRGMAVAYMDARAVQKRLDEVVGPFNWKNVYSLWHDNSQICGISIFNEERNEWVTKFDGAENSDIEPIKGGLSDSFKRSATVWGIGRYLYDMEGVWVEIEPKGRSFAIKQSEYGKLEKEYNAMLNRISGAKPAPQGSSARPAQAASTGNVRQMQPASAGAARQAQPAQAAKEASSRQTLVSPSYEYKVRSIRPSGKSSQFLELVDRN
ncbi:MAG: Rad52/Rad22 family DNA repair protein, partial [Acetatifactor muris]|nr:Rad52/Rad22 family DNA repair protein [Acetatifactor muris]